MCEWGTIQSNTIRKHAASQGFVKRHWSRNLSVSNNQNDSLGGSAVVGHESSESIHGSIQVKLNRQTKLRLRWSA